MELLRYWLSALADVNSFASHRNVRWLRQFFPSLQNLSPSCYISLKTNFSYWKRERGKRFKKQKFIGLSSFPADPFFVANDSILLIEPLLVFPSRFLDSFRWKEKVFLLNKLIIWKFVRWRNDFFRQFFIIFSSIGF